MSIEENNNLPPLQVASKTESNRLLFAKLSTCSTIADTGAIESTTNVLEFFSKCHHCQSVWFSVGKSDKAECPESHKIPILPACFGKWIGLQKTGTNLPSIPFNAPTGGESSTFRPFDNSERAFSKLSVTQTSPAFIATFSGYTHTDQLFL